MPQHFKVAYNAGMRIIQYILIIGILVKILAMFIVIVDVGLGLRRYIMASTEPSKCTYVD